MIDGIKDKAKDMLQGVKDIADGIKGIFRILKARRGTSSLL